MSEFLTQKRIPADNCVMCAKPLEETGGGRIVSQKIRGVCLSGTNKSKGTDKNPTRSFKLFDDQEIYLRVWGEKSKWTDAAIDRARTDYLNGKRPWFCFSCGERKCSTCGSPINYPMGSGILGDTGCSSHVSCFPFNPGCINEDCTNYKKWNNK